jgi:DNA modification methylase
MRKLANTLVEGHVLDVLAMVPDERVHCCVTSPPYWGLRDYGTEPQVWGGGCQHVWGDENISKIRDSNRDTMEWTTGGDPAAKIRGEYPSHGAFCSLCGAWRGSLGLEPSPDLYVQHIVEIFREVRRVLRSDGTLWLNLGASYAGGGRGRGEKGWAGPKQATNVGSTTLAAVPNLEAFKPKDLVPIPWMVALALQADGWWLRSSIIWAKGLSFATHKVECPHCHHKHQAQYSGSCMPESVRDRPTQSYEYVFLLTKRARYFYDAEAVREPTVTEDNRKPYAPGQVDARGDGRDRGGGQPTARDTSGRNLRSVWAINPAPFPEAHFATFPPKLVEPCILAGTSARGVCPGCGGPWERVVEKVASDWETRKAAGATGGTLSKGHNTTHGAGTDHTLGQRESRTIGWRPTCTCGHSDTIPAIVLDPFMGSGRVARVALEHRRHYFGIDLQPEYVEMAARGISTVQPRMLL